MKEMEQLKVKISELREKAAPFLNKADEIWQKVKAVWAVAWPWIWRFRKVLLAIPVVYYGLYFARLNWNLLPEQVGLNLQTTGEYAQYITREMAVYGPLGVTAACLVMMFLSRRTVYPWLICLFSMLLPVLIMVSNIFPA